MKLIHYTVIISLLLCGTTYAKEDCSKISLMVDARERTYHTCRAANALEDIAESLKGVKN